MWKQNVRKRGRQSGKEYVDVTGKTKPGKCVKSISCNEKNCPFRCYSKITEDERKIIFDKFWKLTDDKKSHFYSKHVVRQPAVRKRTKSEVSKKTFSYVYHLYVRGVKIKVCQDFFLATLNISKNRIYYFFKKVQDPKSGVPRSPLTGKHKKKVILDERKELVRKHIASFPTVDSHYCRANSSRKYLETNLNIQRMYDLYKSETEEPVKYHFYRNIFNSEFNIGFLKPKKDLCDLCEAFRCNKTPTQEEISAHEEHIKRRNIGNLERDRDRKALDDNTVGVITFDLQNVFSLPKSNVSSFFYKTKLSCYNLTAHFDKTKVVYCAIWNEMISGRKGNHIANAVFKILQQVVADNPNIKRIIMWSDSCVPQNKNSIMSFALQHFLNKIESENLVQIEQKFGEPGHGNIQEIDNAHSCIERYIRNLDIWSPLSLLKTLVQIPKTWKLSFKVIQMNPQDYKNFEIISATFNYSMIPYTKIKHIIYNKTNIYNVQFRNSFEGQFSVIKLDYKKNTLRRKGNCLSFRSVPITNLTPQLSDLKLKHLSEMLLHMPEVDREFYKVIFKTSANNQIKNNTKKQVTDKKNINASKKKEEEKKKKVGRRAQNKKK